MVAVMIHVACSSNAHGHCNLHGGGNNTHGCRQYGWWQRQHLQPTVVTPMATEDMCGGSVRLLGALDLDASSST